MHCLPGDVWGVWAVAGTSLGQNLGLLGALFCISKASLVCTGKQYRGEGVGRERAGSW